MEHKAPWKIFFFLWWLSTSGKSAKFLTKKTMDKKEGLLGGKNNFISHANLCLQPKVQSSKIPLEYLTRRREDDILALVVKSWNCKAQMYIPSKIEHWPFIHYDGHVLSNIWNTHPDAALINIHHIDKTMLLQTLTKWIFSSTTMRRVRSKIYPVTSLSSPPP